MMRNSISRDGATCQWFLFICQSPPRSLRLTKEPEMTNAKTLSDLAMLRKAYGTNSAMGHGASNLLEALPGIPTVAETVPGYEASTWNGISAPAGTPTEIVEAISGAVAAALADQTFRARLADVGAEPMPMNAPEFGKLIVDDTGKWEKVIKFAGIKPG